MYFVYLRTNKHYNYKLFLQTDLIIYYFLFYFHFKRNRNSSQKEILSNNVDDHE